MVTFKMMNKCQGFKNVGRNGFFCVGRNGSTREDHSYFHKHYANKTIRFVFCRSVFLQHCFMKHSNLYVCKKFADFDIKCASNLYADAIRVYSEISKIYVWVHTQQETIKTMFVCIKIAKYHVKYLNILCKRLIVKECRVILK